MCRRNSNRGRGGIVRLVGGRGCVDGEMRELEGIEEGRGKWGGGGSVAGYIF